jgi:hypothetical protein
MVDGRSSVVDGRWISGFDDLNGLFSAGCAQTTEVDA